MNRPTSPVATASSSETVVSVGTSAHPPQRPHSANPLRVNSSGTGAYRRLQATLTTAIHDAEHDRRARREALSRILDEATNAVRSSTFHQRSLALYSAPVAPPSPPTPSTPSSSLLQTTVASRARTHDYSEPEPTPKAHTVRPALRRQRSNSLPSTRLLATARLSEPRTEAYAEREQRRLQEEELHLARLRRSAEAAAQRRRERREKRYGHTHDEPQHRYPEERLLAHLEVRGEARERIAAQLEDEFAREHPFHPQTNQRMPPPENRIPLFERATQLHQDRLALHTRLAQQKAEQEESQLRQPITTAVTRQVTSTLSERQSALLERRAVAIANAEQAQRTECPFEPELDAHSRLLDTQKQRKVRTSAGMSRTEKLSVPSGENRSATQRQYYAQWSHVPVINGRSAQMKRTHAQLAAESQTSRNSAQGEAQRAEEERLRHACPFASQFGVRVFGAESRVSASRKDSEGLSEWNRRKREWEEKGKSAQMEREMSECTFAPETNTGKSARKKSAEMSVCGVEKWIEKRVRAKEEQERRQAEHEERVFGLGNGWKNRQTVVRPFELQTEMRGNEKRETEREHAEKRKNESECHFEIVSAHSKWKKRVLDILNRD